jgi:hypothetical protein
MPLVECHIAGLYSQHRPYREGGASHFLVAPQVSYECYLKHRQEQPHRNPRYPHRRVASQWSVSCIEECVSFATSAKQHWVFDLTSRDGIVESRHGWGLHLTPQGPAYLGVSRSGDSVFIAKFVDGTATHRWHGYPADYLSNVNDAPAPEVLAKWADVYLPAPKVRKLSQHLRCRL